MQFTVSKVRFALIGKKREIMRASRENLKRLRDFDCFFAPSVSPETKNEAMLAIWHAADELRQVMRSAFTLDYLWKRPFVELSEDEQRTLLFAETVSAMFFPSARPAPTLAIWSRYAPFINWWRKWQSAYARAAGALMGRLISEGLSQFISLAIPDFERALCEAPGSFVPAVDSGVARARVLSNRQRIRASSSHAAD